LFPMLFICSYRTFVRYNTWSLVLYTWTNVSNINCQFLIPCYHQNSSGFIVKHILFQQLPLRFIGRIWYGSLVSHHLSFFGAWFMERCPLITTFVVEVALMSLFAIFVWDLMKLLCICFSDVPLRWSFGLGLGVS